MNKRGNLLINALLTISLSSIVLLSMSKASYQLHNIQSITHVRDIETTYINVTLDNFLEDAEEQLTYYSELTYTYTSEEFQIWIDDWFANIDECQSPISTNNDPINWDQLFRTGKLDEGSHVFTASCATDTTNIDYVMNVEYTVQADYTGPGGSYQSNQVQCYTNFRQQNCDNIQNEDNWDIIYNLHIVESYYQ